MFLSEDDSPDFNEQEYIADYNQSVSKSLRLPTGFGFFAYNSYLILDYIEVPEIFSHLALVRLGIVSPIAMLLLGSLRLKTYKVFTRQIVFLTAIILGLSVVYIDWCRNPHMLSKEPIGIVFCSMYALTALRMQRREAVFYSLTILTAILVLLSHEKAPAAAWFSYLSAVGVGCALGVGVAAMIENSWRINFAQKKIIALREAQAANLLEMVLPVSIADRLKSETTSIADYAPQVSVLFADIEGFTTISEKLPPAQLVSDLDKIFSRLDHLCAICGCEKIKTVGDAYLAVSGVPLPADDHAARIIRLALAFQADAENLSLGGVPIKFRIGIHSGPVVAGVIGKSRFSYDLWGDTVNTASRMESSAPSGSIQISSEAAKLVAHEFILELRGEVEIKGKGSRKTWLVKGIKDKSRSTDEEILDKIA